MYGIVIVDEAAVPAVMIVSVSTAEVLDVNTLYLDPTTTLVSIM